MWPLALIIGAAAACAAILTGTGVALAVSFERRRHRRLMSRHALERTLSMLHRPTNLSISDIGYNTIPRPNRASFTARTGLPPSEETRTSRFYSTLPLEDDLPTQVEDVGTDGITESRAFTTPSPSTKSKKKTPTLSTMGPCVGSPMSAITEATEPKLSPTPVTSSDPRLTSQAPHELVELSAEVTPTKTPASNPSARELDFPIKEWKSDAIDGRISIISIPAKALGYTLEGLSDDTPVKTRSVSLSSMLSPGPPPDTALPDLPADVWRVSRTSLRRSRTSHSGPDNAKNIVAELPASPVHATTAVPVINSIQAFAFGFDNINPKTQKTNGQSAIPRSPGTSITAPSTILPSKPTLAINVEAARADSGLKTIDASSWTKRPLPRLTPTTPTFSAQTLRPHNRFTSVQDDELFIDSPTNTVKATLQRRSSCTSTDTSHTTLSSPSTGQKKGHKRQNCIRLSGLTPIDARQRLSQQLQKCAIQEEGSETPSRLSSQPIELEATRVRSPSSSMTAGFISSSPAVPPPDARSNMSLRVRGPRLVTNRIHSNETPPVPSPELTQSKIEELTLQKARFKEPEILTSPLAASNTRSVHVNLVSSAQDESKRTPRSASPVLLSPSRQKSRIIGPRIQYSSCHANVTVSPIRVKSTMAVTDEPSTFDEAEVVNGDMQKSSRVSQMSTASENVKPTNVSQAPSIWSPTSASVSRNAISPPKMRIRSKTVSGYHSDPRIRTSQARLSQEFYGNEPRTSSTRIASKPFATNTPTLVTNTSVRPMRSTSIISIWEDEPVRDSSLEPQLPSIDQHYHRNHANSRSNSPERILRKQRLEASNKRQLATPAPLRTQAKREILQERIDAFEAANARFSGHVSPVQPLPQSVFVGQTQAHAEAFALAKLSQSTTNQSLPLVMTPSLVSLPESGASTQQVQGQMRSSNRNRTPNLAQLRDGIARQRKEENCIITELNSPKMKDTEGPIGLELRIASKHVSIGVKDENGLLVQRDCMRK